MKKVICCILILSLVLAATVFAMPNTQKSSVKMSDAQMMQAVGGCDWFLIGMWLAAGMMTGGALAVVAGFGAGVVFSTTC
jgi:hypothetical protein